MRRDFLMRFHSTSIRSRAAWSKVALAMILSSTPAACAPPDPSPREASPAAGRRMGSGMTPVSTVANRREPGSRVTDRRERTLSNGERACDVGFVYAGGEPESVFWREPCSRVDARMVDAAELRSGGRWDRLDAFQRNFVSAMPGGLVLLIEGSSSASVYPIDETGSSIEVPVAD